MSDPPAHRKGVKQRPPDAWKVRTRSPNDTPQFAPHARRSHPRPSPTSPLSPSRTACARTSSSASDPAAPPSSPARGATVNPPPSSATASARSSRTYSPRRSRAPSDDETTRLTHQPTPTPPPLPRTTPRRNGRTGHLRSRPRPTTACGTTNSSSSHEPAQLCRHHRHPVTHHHLHPSMDPPRRGTKPPRV